MNFEKVELYGFKSFADKAEIKFGNGITGIVGPNGCGKSNVADAIRWVLGEQSAKSLRGSKMQDVIFAGTQNRKSLSYCEVSLYFDNSNKIFKSLDYTEVIITRKLYRSGESEYFINKQPSRLRDIVDLLHECGIGKEGYTIIGQGKVEEIMSAKPEDRRMIFEEATGIAKFKSRKIESERKLDRTHENLVRYVDIITEIENQLGPLEKQAEKAKEFNELSEQLKFHELNTYIAKVDGVESAKAKINDKISGINEQVQIRQNEMNEAQREYENIFADISATDERLKKLNDELLEKRVGMEKASGDKRLFEQRISFFEGQIERSEKEIVDNENLINQSNETLQKNEQILIDSNANLENLTKQSDEFSKKIVNLSQKIALGEELAEQNRQQIIKSIESLSDIKMSEGAASIEKRNLLEKIDELNNKLTELNAKRDNQFTEKENVDKNIDDLDRGIFDCKNKIEKKEEEVRLGNEQVASVENKIYSLNSIISTLVTRDSFYRGLKENYEGYSTSVKLLMNKAKENANVSSKIKGVVAELIKSDKKFDVALETALAAAAQNIVTKDPEDAKYLIEYLKANNLGRVTFLPITSVKARTQTTEITLALRENGALGVANELVSFDRQYANIISNLLGNTLIVDTLENATRIAKKYSFSFKIVTLDGDMFSTQGSMSGGSRRKDTAGLLSNDRKIEDNAKLLSEKRAEMDELKKSKSVLETKRDKSFEELGILNDLCNEKRQQVVVEREKQSICEKTLSELGREIENNSELIEDVKSRLQVASENIENISEGGKKLKEDKEKATTTADKHQQEYDALKKQRDELLEKNTNVQVEITSLKAKIDALSADSVRLNKIITETTENNKHLRDSNENALQMIEQLKRDEEKVTLSKEEQDKINAVREQIDKVDSYKAELREKLNKNGEKRDSLTEILNDLSEKKHKEEIDLAKIDSDLENMGNNILEDYQETYETAVKFRAENYNAKEGEAEINRIRRKRSSLGAINATAIDESKILRERYEDMLTQKEDLEKAENDLKEAIEKIKGEMLSQFDEGFNKINENFQRIFKELFGGGRAMLELDYTEVEDKLEAGIEIIAEPPGKKLQKLSLLSGGEKALTAIAILFAILKLRPMPFCVLDEIEAALDEANVDRFARYLKKFSEDTQFIVITHRKPTMELADALFGVTMQEKGVSKTVSVKLSDVEKIEGDMLA